RSAGSERLGHGQHDVLVRHRGCQSMTFFVAITDYDWFQLHAAKPNVEEVNFWRPSSDASFKALHIGEPLLFKLHAPRNYIVGGGFYTKYLQLRVSLAWD